MKTPRTIKRLVVLSLALAAALLTGATSRALGDCGPFTDITFFCSPILELYYLGISAGTSPTTYAPTQTMTRGEVAALVARSFNQTVKRTSRRAALGQWWTTQGRQSLGLTDAVAGIWGGVAFDGADLWVASYGNGGTVSRVRASDGKLLETWTGVPNGPWGVLVAMGRVFVTGGGFTSTLYMIDPSQPAGTVTAVTDPVPAEPYGGMAFDGSRIWTANSGTGISIITPGPTLPWSVSSVAPAGSSIANGVVFDGSNVWVADNSGLLKLDAAGAVLQIVTGAPGYFPVFDGTNIWVPSGHGSVAVVRASTGALVATLTGNGLNEATAAAFDGERILVTNRAGESVSLWRAADLTALGHFSTGAAAYRACSDGLNFWISLGSGELARF